MSYAKLLCEEQSSKSNRLVKQLEVLADLVSSKLTKVEEALDAYIDSVNTLAEKVTSGEGPEERSKAIGEFLRTKAELGKSFELISTYTRVDQLPEIESISRNLSELARAKLEKNIEKIDEIRKELRPKLATLNDVRNLFHDWSNDLRLATSVLRKKLIEVDVGVGKQFEDIQKKKEAIIAIVVVILLLLGLALYFIAKREGLSFKEMVKKYKVWIAAMVGVFGVTVLVTVVSIWRLSKQEKPIKKAYSTLENIMQRYTAQIKNLPLNKEYIVKHSEELAQLKDILLNLRVEV